MKTLWLLMVTALCAAVVLADNVYVVEADDANFDQVVDGSKNSLVAFVAPWCGHCKHLKPDFEAAAQHLKAFSDVVQLVQVDADANKKTGGRFQVKGFPTIKYFEKGSTEPKDYSGPRDTEGIVQWVNDNFGTKARIAKEPAAVKVLTEANFDTIVMDKDKDVLVEFYAPWCGHCKQLAPTYEKVAQSMKSESNCVVANVDSTVSKSLGERYGVTGFPTLKFFPRGTSDKTPEDYTGGREEGDLMGYLNEKCGTQRISGGLLADTAGRVDVLDGIAKEIATEGSSKALATKMEEASKAHDTGKYYVKAAQRIAERGEEFVEKEMGRLQAFVDQGSITLDKRDQFQLRLNVLRAFRKATKDEL